MVNGKKYRVDSYNPGKEIVSRKFSQLSQVKEETAIGYLNELKHKYPPGAEITDSPFNPQKLRGEWLDGEMILEVPVRTQTVPQSILDAAAQKGIKIRDVDGKVYK
ncbi:MAG TPA: hypothetical protein PLI94_10520 [Bacillota bacterium]|mgnify:CR=1 FL=1|nr:hypothetical protein [Bacillota bacterium]HPT68454.1 hypothetical protein [Bacillota bacterium]